MKYDFDPFGCHGVPERHKDRGLADGLRLIPPVGGQVQAVTRLQVDIEKRRLLKVWVLLQVWHEKVNR